MCPLRVAAFITTITVIYSLQYVLQKLNIVSRFLPALYPCEVVKHQLSGSVVIIKGDGECRWYQARCGLTAHWLVWFEGSRPPGTESAFIK